MAYAKMMESSGGIWYDIVKQKLINQPLGDYFITKE